MSIYFQRERRNTELTIPTNEMVSFDIPIASSQTIPQPDNPNDPLPLPEADFFYHSNGSIDLFRASTFIAGWNIASVAGMSTDGQAFQLKKRDYEAEASDPLAGEIWIPIANGTSAFKISSSSGFAIILVSEAEILAYNKATIALFNVSNDTVKLSRHSQTKAGILLFGIGPVDADIINLYQFVNELFEFISYSDVHVFNANYYPFYLPQSGTGNNPNPSELIPLTPGYSPSDRHYQIGVIWSGYTYNFWFISPNNSRTLVIESGKQILLSANDFEPLSWYQGQTTYGTAWINSNGSYKLIPIMFDSTGIYTNIGNRETQVSNIKFTQTLILTPPNPPIP